MTLLILFFILIWLPGFLSSIFLQFYWWQNKEYRVDRFKAFLDTDIGKQLFFGKISLAKFTLLPLLIFVPLLGSLIFILFYGWFALKLTLKRSLTSPKWTLRMKETLTLLLILTLAIGLGFFSLLGVGYLITFVILDFLSPLLAGFSILLIGKFVEFYKQNIISKASQKISSMDKLIVIGVTGSYGKTTTKEFIGQLLSSKFKVLTTPEHVNTEIGVAQFILDKLTPRVEVLVVEMGAYRIGEIAALCRMVKPKIGVLTAISNQHLALFGSIENIANAKFELVDYLDKHQGTAILNGDNEVISKKAASYHLPKIFYSLKTKADIYAYSIKERLQGLEFTLYWGKNKKQVKAKILGKQNTGNILAALAVGLKLDLPFANLAKNIANLKSVEATMELSQSSKGGMFIDDSYNINPVGVKMALDTLTTYKNFTKTAVLSPMIELGDQAISAHKDILEYALERADQVVWVGMDFMDLVQDFAKSKKVENRIKIYKTSKTASSFLTNFNSKNNVILFEGRNSQSVLEVLK